MFHAVVFFFIVALMSSTSAAAPAAPPAQPDAASLARALDKLQVVGGVLYVAAHPDDENTLLLAWLSGEQLLRTGYLSVTRGDGGQNLVGAEQGPLLGLIRTEELLAARRLDGAEQLFTRARDFGYSKGAEEALRIWGHDDTLADVVLAIRRFKPDVIITRFSPDDTETHGHHTASARLAVEAFAKAGDPAYHPEQVKQHGVWRPRRVVWNASQFPGAPPRDFSGFVKLDVGAYNAMRGLSWGELAADSRSMHKSQGFGAARRRGPAPEYFKVLVGEPIKTSPMDGVVTDWSRVAGAGKLASVLHRARATFRPSQPELVIPTLLEARDELDRLPENHWKSTKRAEIDAAVVACTGLFVEVTGSAASVARGGTLPVTVSVLARRPAAVTLASAKLPGHEVRVGKALVTGIPLDVNENLAVSDSAPLSNPYWLELPPEPGRYPVPDEKMIGLPAGPAPLEADVELVISGHPVVVRRAVAYKWTDPVLGERYRAVEVLPAVTVNLEAPVLLFPDPKPRDLHVRVRSLAGASGSVRLDAPDGFVVAPRDAPFKVAASGEAELTFHVTPPGHPQQPSTGTLRAVATVATVNADPRKYDRGLRRIEHEHIPIQTLLSPAEIRVVRVEVVRRGHKVGYLPGAGDEIPSALRELGYEVVTFDPKAFTPANLAGLGTIVTGVRAWNVEPDLVAMHGALMDWVARGGTLVAEYNTNSRIGPAPPDLGPFPFTISHDRTTDENAAVLLAKDPILATPNAITAADFEGWVQERGLYYADTWDPRYRAPLTMSDPGEKPTRGALLIGKHGKGTFIYTGLSFFRQLPAGVPGAYRLFVNLIEHGG